MRSWLIVFSLICLFLPVPSFGTDVLEATKDLPAPEGFQEDLSLQALQNRAHEANLPYLVYLQESSSRQARKMLKYSWVDADVQRILQQDFLAGAYHALDEGGQLALIQEHEVFAFPALLIFSPQGHLLGKTEGYVAPETLAGILNKHVEMLSHQRDMLALARGPSRSQPEVGQSVPRGQRTLVITPPLLVGHITALTAERSSKPPLARVVSTRNADGTLEPIANLSELSLRGYRAALGVADASYLQTGMQSRSQESGKLLIDVPGLEAYSLRLADRSAPDQYGLLIGNYLSYNEINEEVTRYERLWHDEIFVYCEEVQSNLVYRLILGQYEEESTAKAYAQAMYNVIGMNPSIVNLKGLIP